LPLPQGPHDSWLGGYEAKLVQPVKTQDNPINITKQLEDLKVLSNGGQDGGKLKGRGTTCTCMERNLMAVLCPHSALSQEKGLETIEEFLVVPTQQ